PALQYMHERGLVHHDLKLENIMLDKPVKPYWSLNAIITGLLQSNFKLIDFGLARRHTTQEETKLCGGTRDMCSLEKLYREQYNPFAADVYSFGMVLLIVLIGHNLYSAVKNDYPRDSK